VAAATTAVNWGSPDAQGDYYAADPSNSQYQMEYAPGQGYSFSDPYSGQSQFNVNNTGFVGSLGQAAQNFQTDFGTPGGAIGALPSGYSATPAAAPAASAPQTTGGGVGSVANQTASGLPTPAATASMAPLPVQDFGALPSITPTYAAGASAAGGTPVNAAQSTAATVDPNQSKAYMDAAYAQEAQALAPQFQQQQMNLQDSSAARGISSSGAAGELQGNLLGQQASALAAADAPITQQGYQYSQNDIAQNQANQQQSGLANQQADIATGEYNSSQQQQNNQYNAGLTEQNNQYNAGVGNTAAQENANYYASALGTNESNYNNYLATLENQGYNTSNEELGAYLNSYLPNSGVTSTITGAQQAGSNAYNGAYGAQVSGQNAILGAAGSAFGGFSSAPAGGYSGPATNNESFGGWGGDDGNGFSGGG
jgi:hypothetical protein